MRPNRTSQLRKKASVGAATDGDRPGIFFTTQTKMDAARKKQQWEQIIAPRYLPLTRENTYRTPFPVTEKNKVAVAKVRPDDHELLQASFARCDTDYILIQAPHKDNYQDIWRLAWQESCRLIVSISDSFSETDNERCYPYFPTKDGQLLTVQSGRFSIKLSKRTQNKGFSVYELLVMSTEEADNPKTERAVKGEGGEGAGEEGNEAQTESAEKKARRVTVLHFEDWVEGQWPDINMLGAFVIFLSKQEVNVMRSSTDGYVPPVIIQGHDANGRGAVIWLGTVLMKDIEKKSSFDVEDLTRKLARMRPGALNTPVYFFTCFSLAFRLAGLGGWIGPEESKKHAREVEDAYKEGQSRIMKVV